MNGYADLQHSGVLTYWTDATANIPQNYTMSWTSDEFENLAQSLNQSIFIGTNATFALYVPQFTENVDQVNEALSIIKEGFVQGNNDSYNTWINDGVQSIWTSLANSIFNTYAFEVPEELEELNTSSNGEMLAAIQTIGVVVFYLSSADQRSPY